MIQLRETFHVHLTLQPSQWVRLRFLPPGIDLLEHTTQSFSFLPERRTALCCEGTMAEVVSGSSEDAHNCSIRVHMNWNLVSLRWADEFLYEQNTILSMIEKKHFFQNLWNALSPATWSTIWSSRSTPPVCWLYEEIALGSFLTWPLVDHPSTNTSREHQARILLRLLFFPGQSQQRTLSCIDALSHFRFG